MVLNVSVGASSVSGLNSPYGTSPSLIRAWNPLQIPRTNPSLIWRSSSMASMSFALRNTAAINLPLPSGSSPAEKPPGNMTICDLEIRLAISSTDSFSSAASLFLMMKMSVSAPARSKALALSTSQLVPGIVGINTFGLVMAVFTAKRNFGSVSAITGIVPVRFSARLGKIGSKVFSYAQRRSSREISVSATFITSPPIVPRILVCGCFAYSSANSGAVSTMIAP